MATLATSWDAGSSAYVGRFRMVATRANGQPAVAAYTRRAVSAAYRAFAISVLGIDEGPIVELTAFHDTRLFAAFGLPTADR